MDPTQAGVSRQVVRLANWLDGFFGDERVYQESQGSYLKLNISGTLEEGLKTGFSGDLRGKLVLPRTEKRLNLLIESDSGPTGDDSTGEAPLPAETGDAQDQSIALRYTARTKPLWRIHADAGIRYRAGLDPFARLRLRRSFPLTVWNIRATETLYWFRSLGLGETTRLDLERYIRPDYLFRATSQATWRKETRLFDLGQDFYLLHNISQRRAIIYHAGASGQSEPTARVLQYLLNVRLRQQIHRQWLFFEIKPQLTFARENNFDSLASITFTLELLFGG